MSKRILIVDDHTAIRNGVRNILSAAFSNLRFEEAKDTAETLEKIESSNWDVIILDIDLPGSPIAYAILPSKYVDPIVSQKYNLWLGFSTTGTGNYHQRAFSGFYCLTLSFVQSLQVFLHR